MSKMTHITGRIFVLLMIAIFSTTIQARSHGTEKLEASAEQTTVFMPVANKYSPWTTPYAVETNFSVAEGAILSQPLRELGTSWVRMNDRISWAQLQPEENGPIQWGLLTNFENELRALHQMNAKPIVVVDSYPNWATMVANTCSPLKPDKYDDFANFVTALVQRYRTAEFNVKNWELGNEVDIDPVLVPLNSQYGCWGNISDLQYYGGEAYGNMVTVVGNAIKQADPKARVWIGGLVLNSPNTTDPNAGKPERFLRGVLSVGAAPYFDVVPFHAHTNYSNMLTDPESHGSGDWQAWGGSMVGKANYLRQMMAEYGVSKTLSVDEIGVGCKETEAYCLPEPGADFLDFHASMLVRLAVRAAATQLESFVWFTLDGPGWRSMGLLDGQTKRPAYFAYQNLIQKITGMNYSYPVVYSSDIEAYAFSNSTEVMQVVWAEFDGNYPFTVPSNKFIAAFDRSGNLITPIVVGSNYQFTATFSPIYIEVTH